jgi:hypothetical protein
MVITKALAMIKYFILGAYSEDNKAQMMVMSTLEALYHKRKR